MSNYIGSRNATHSEENVIIRKRAYIDFTDKNSALSVLNDVKYRNFK